MKAKIQVLVGMIASGKSSYCKNAARQGAIIVNDDSIVNLVHADDYTLYDKSLKLLYKSTENHIINMAVAMKRIAIVDRGLNISLRGRKRWVTMAHSFDISCEAIVFPREVDEIHANRRALSDNRGYDCNYWLKVARHHSSEYVSPSKDEGFDALYYITWEDIQAGKVIDPCLTH